MPSLFVYDSTRHRFLLGGRRPTNQSTPAVRDKVVALHTDPKRMDLQRQRPSVSRFVVEHRKGVSLQRMNGGRGVDMSHVISAKELATLIATAMNEYDRATMARKKLIRFQMQSHAEEFVSSDEDDDQEEVKGHVKDMLKPMTPAQRIGSAERLLRRLNRSSRNLFGGDASANRSIQGHQDIPTDTANKVPGFVAARISITAATWRLLGRQPSEFNPLPGKKGSGMLYESSTR